MVIFAKIIVFVFKRQSQNEFMLALWFAHNLFIDLCGIMNWNSSILTAVKLDV